MIKTLKKISTTALSKTLDLNNKELFEILQDLNLICREEKRWCLTSKGEKYGGEMFSNPELNGEYVVCQFSPKI